MLETRGDEDQAQVPVVLVDPDDHAQVPAILADDDDDGDNQAQVPGILRGVVFACISVAIICTVVKSNIEISWPEDLSFEGKQSKHVIAHLFLILCSICVLWIAAVSCAEAYLSGRRQPSISDVETGEAVAVDVRPLLHDSLIANC